MRGQAVSREGAADRRQGAARPAMVISGRLLHSAIGSICDQGGVVIPRQVDT